MTFERPELFRDSVSELNRHSNMSWPRADSKRSPTWDYFSITAPLFLLGLQPGEVRDSPQQGCR